MSQSLSHRKSEGERRRGREREDDYLTRNLVFCSTPIYASSSCLCVGVCVRESVGEKVCEGVRESVNVIVCVGMSLCGCVRVRVLEKENVLLSMNVTVCICCL